MNGSGRKKRTKKEEFVDGVMEQIEKAKDPEPAHAQPIGHFSEKQLEKLDAFFGAPEQFTSRDERYAAVWGHNAVYTAISNISEAFSKDGISKGRQNTEQGYAFRGIDQVLERLSPLLAENGLIIVPRVLERTRTEHETRRGGVMFQVALRVEFEFISALDGSSIKVITYGEGGDTGDKGSNKALTAAYKYAVLTVFAIPIPTTPDTDADQTTNDDILGEEKDRKFNEKFALWISELKTHRTYDALVKAVQAGDDKFRFELRSNRELWESLKKGTVAPA